MHSSDQGSFKKRQLQYQRVKQADNRLGPQITEKLNTLGIGEGSFHLFVRAFKAEDTLEVWIRSAENQRYALLESFKIAGRSGGPGPKRKQGDLQVPEGFYQIDRYNPLSNFHLSMGINYPNPSDKILSNQSRPGGDIFIHGNEVTVGCIPITDEKIEELYLWCIEAKDRGQETIPVTIFPGRFPLKQTDVLDRPLPESVTKGLWLDLEKAYDYFEESGQLAEVNFLSNGRHEITGP